MSNRNHLIRGVPVFRKSNEFPYIFHFILCYLNFQFYVSYFTVFIKVDHIMELWIHPKKNILSETGCHITILIRNTGFLQIQLHSFIMATTRYIFVFHSNLLLKLNLTTNVSATICNVYTLGVSPSLVSRYCEGYSFL